MESFSSIPLSPPLKSKLRPRAEPAAVSDQLPTPEKPADLPPRTRNRSFALSLKEVKQIAHSLQKPRSGQNPTRPDSDLPSPASPKPSKPRTPIIKLIDKYEILVEFFNSLESSIRLLKLKGTSPTFTNVAASIRNLMERRFTYGHLGQLKHVLPEAIVIKKVLLRDAATSCMKPELHVSLDVDGVEDTVRGKGESGYSVLRRIFRERLVDFAKKHPEGDDIPEEQLPHPFNQTKAVINSDESTESSSRHLISSSVSNAHSLEEFAVSSHMSPSFQKRFSQRISILNAPKTPLSCISNTPHKDDSLVSVATSPVNCNSKPPLRRKSLLGYPIISPSSSALLTHEKEAKTEIEPEIISQNASKSSEGTPAKLISSPVRLMTSTPEIQTPKRCRSPSESDMTPMKSARRSTRSKLLFSTPKKNSKEVEEETEAVAPSGVDDVISFLPASLLQSIKEKERKAVEERQAGVSEAKKRQKLIARLPSIFDMILLVFQSSSRSVITKQELTHKLIANNCKIVDKGEVEEQLKLLQELVPDWISEKIASTGDILYSVNKLSSPEELRQRFTEAE